MQMADGDSPAFRFPAPEPAQDFLDREQIRPLQERLNALYADQERLILEQQRHRFEAVARHLTEIIRVGRAVSPNEIQVIALLHGEFWVASGTSGFSDLPPFLLKDDYPHPYAHQFRYLAAAGAPAQFIAALVPVVRPLGYEVAIRNLGMAARPAPFVVLIPKENPP